MSPRILSGIQPSGELHLGNYFGAIRQLVTRQERGDELFVFIADWHALTTVHEPEVLRKNIAEILLTYLACGLDPEKIVLYRQSSIVQIPELAWILSCRTPVGLMERAHSYKDKVAKGIEASCGLFTYPILMAADILIMQSEVVPVGKDQKQHVEIARDIAQKFNSHYGEVFTLPAEEIDAKVATVPGLDGQKMSKSYGNTIPLFASDSELMKLAKLTQTDSRTPEEPKDPESVTPFTLLKLVNPEQAKELEPMLKKGGLGYGDLKKTLGEELVKFIAPFRERRTYYESNPARLQEILVHGQEKASLQAKETLEKVRTAVGL